MVSCHELILVKISNLSYFSCGFYKYTSDDDSDVGPQKVPHRSQFCEEGPNDDRVSDVEEVSETNFGDNSSIPINHIDELEKQQSVDPFNIYRLLRKQPGDDSHE
nr:hypothetical protein [Tanacetum cinerariifolium]